MQLICKTSIVFFLCVPFSQCQKDIDIHRLNLYSAEPVLEILLFFTCSNMGALICNYLLDEASREHEFLTMNQQDGHLQFEPKWINLRS
jgi:hypothetical protein